MQFELNLETLKTIHDSAIDAIITIDCRGLIRTANPATEVMFGYSVDELIGQKVNLLMPNPYREEHDQYIERFISTRDARIIGIGREVEAVRKDGTRFPIHLGVSEAMANGQPVFVGYIRDLSQYKEAELKMQSQLLIKERLATIGQTVSGLAHESRNALQRSHACLAELELDLADKPNSLLLVRKIQRALDDLHQLLEEVRNYAAPIILERRPISIELLIREAWQNLLDVKGQSKVPEMSIFVQPGFPTECMVDGDRFRQVIRNLFDNAWFACKEPKKILVNLKFKTDPYAPNNFLCSLEMIDNGAGIGEAEAEKIFNPFYTTKTKGTGLGLALSRRYIETHGGRVYFQMAPAENASPDTPPPSTGATFVVEFPHH